MDVFPFSIKGEEPNLEGWIFSVLDCFCSREEIALALANGDINQNYHDQLIENLHDGTKKEESYKPI